LDFLLWLLLLELEELSEPELLGLEQLERQLLLQPVQLKEQEQQEFLPKQGQLPLRNL
jgi:hypothetical protein